MEGGSETVRGVVSDANGILFARELLDSADWSEDLLLDDLHVIGTFTEDGWLDVVALVSVALTTNLDLGTGLLALLDVAHDTVELELRDLGALEGVWLEWVADLVLVGTLLEAGHELVVDALLDEDTGAGTAALAVVVVDAEVDPADGIVNVGVVEDDVGALSAELEGDLLQVRLGGGLEDLATNDGGAGEGNLVDIHVGGDGGTGNTTEARNDVDNTGGETSLDDEVADVETAERGLLCGLHDDGVTGGQGRADLPGKHEQGEVPGDDLAADTDGLVAGIGEGLVVGVDDFALDLVGPAAVVSEAPGSVGDVCLGHGQGLAVVEGLDGGNDLDVSLEQVGELGQHAAPLAGGDLSPGTLDGSTGSRNCSVDVLLGSFMDGTDDLLIVRVDSLEGLALGALDVLVVDEPVLSVSIYIYIYIYKISS